jgi:hypothetical protein
MRRVVIAESGRMKLAANLTRAAATGRFVLFTSFTQRTPPPCGTVRRMSRPRVGIARALIIFFSLVQIFATAPMLHAHDADDAEHGEHRSISAREQHEHPAPTQCLACHVAHLNVAMSFGATFAPPVEQRILSFDVPVDPTNALRLGLQLGRAPPTA